MSPDVESIEGMNTPVPQFQGKRERSVECDSSPMRLELDLEVNIFTLLSRNHIIYYFSQEQNMSNVGFGALD